MDPNNARLRIATRIHYALRRWLGQGIDVERMLLRPAYAKEVLHVCHGCGDIELRALAIDFEALPAPVEAPVEDAVVRMPAARSERSRKTSSRRVRSAAAVRIDLPTLPAPTRASTPWWAAGWWRRWVLRAG